MTKIADLRSHSETRRLMGWTTADLADRREWEWSDDDGGESLVVRTCPDDPEAMALNLRAALLVRWPTRADAIIECVSLVMSAGVTALDLSYEKFPDGLVIPAGVTTLYLSGVNVSTKVPTADEISPVVGGGSRTKRPEPATGPHQKWSPTANGA